MRRRRSGQSAVSFGYVGSRWAFVNCVCSAYNLRGRSAHSRRRYGACRSKLRGMREWDVQCGAQRDSMRRVARLCRRYLRKHDGLGDERSILHSLRRRHVHERAQSKRVRTARFLRAWDRAACGGHLNDRARLRPLFWRVLLSRGSHSKACMSGRQLGPRRESFDRMCGVVVMFCGPIRRHRGLDHERSYVFRLRGWNVQHLREPSFVLRMDDVRGGRVHQHGRNNGDRSRVHRVRERHVLEYAESNRVRNARLLRRRHKADASGDSDEPYAMRKLRGGHVLRRRHGGSRSVLG